MRTIGGHDLEDPSRRGFVIPQPQKRPKMVEGEPRVVVGHRDVADSLEAPDPQRDPVGWEVPELGERPRLLDLEVRDEDPGLSVDRFGTDRERTKSNRDVDRPPEPGMGEATQEGRWLVSLGRSRAGRQSQEDECVTLLMI